MKFVGFVSVVWCVVLASLSAAIFIARYDAKSRLHVLKFDSCELPCWLDIVPKKTTLKEAELLIKSAFKGNNDFTAPDDYFFVIQDKSLSTIRIVLHKVPNAKVLNTYELQLSKSNISLADVIDQFGSPTEIVPLGMGGGTFPALLYEKQQVAIIIDEPDAIINNCLNSFMHRAVLYIYFGDLSDTWGLNQPQRWRGFTCYQWKPHPIDD